MNLKEILSVSGKSGLFKMISRGNNKVIVESLENKSRMPLFATMKASALSDICIFTEEEDMPLQDVFKKIYDTENGGKAIDVKSAKDSDLKSYMEKVLPEYDRERVHVSDMKKLFAWYNLLYENQILSFEENNEEVQNQENKEAE